MKALLYIMAIFFFMVSCKNASEEKETAESVMEEQPIIELEPEIDLPEEIEEESDEEEEPEAKIKSIFDHGMNTVYVKKESLNEEELAFMQNLIENDPDIVSQNMITDLDIEYLINLPKLKSHVGNSPESMDSLKDLIELNVAYGSISKGYEVIAQERLREIIGDSSGSFIEDMMRLYLFKGRTQGQTALRRIGVASQDNIEPILLEFFEVNKEELEFLKTFPKTEKISNMLAAKRAINFEIPVAVNEHLESSSCTVGFKEAVAFFSKRLTAEPNRFMRSANKAKAEFYKLNPGWYGENEDIGNTYVDSRRKYIYLPFGDLSFADEVISHDLGTDGSNSAGVLGEPDMALENFRLKDTRIGNLGLNGVLTLEFTNNALTDVNGPDLYVFEMGKIEPTKLEISKDGKDWLEIGKIEGGTAKVDIAEFVKPGETFNYIRLTDLDTYSTVPGADVDAVAAIGGAVRLNIDSSVLFDTAEFKLKESATSELEKLLEGVKEIPKGTIIVEGHTDNVGSPQSNLKLSKNRANEVSVYLKSNLPDDYNYSIKGYGETRPVAPNDSDENKQKNRRVEILIIPSNS